MTALHCNLCGRPVDDREADVVADRRELLGPGAGPERLRVACHACLADPAHAGRYESFWKLDWLRGNYLGVARGLMVELVDGQPGRLKSREAVDDFVGLGYFLLPGQEPDGDGRLDGDGRPAGAG